MFTSHNVVLLFTDPGRGTMQCAVQCSDGTDKALVRWNNKARSAQTHQANIKSLVRKRNQTTRTLLNNYCLFVYMFDSLLNNYDLLVNMLYFIH